MNEITLREYIDQIRETLRAGQPGEVVEMCRHVLNHYPKCIGAYVLLGQALLDQHDYDQSGDVFNLVLSADPENIVAYVGVSMVHEKKGMLDEAIWNMERAFEINPNNVGIREELMRLRGERDGIGRYRIKLTSSALGRLYAQGDLYTQAIHEFENVLRQEPARLDIQLALAEALWRNNRSGDAVDLCQQILTRAPNNLKANLLLGKIWQEMGMAGEGHRLLQLAQDLDPDNDVAQDMFEGQSPLPLRRARLPLPTPADVPGPEDTRTALEETPAPAGGQVPAVSVDVTIPDWMRADLLFGEELVEEPPAEEPEVPQLLPDDVESEPAQPQPQEPAPAPMPAVAVPDWIQSAVIETTTEPPAPGEPVEALEPTPSEDLPAEEAPGLASSVEESPPPAIPASETETASVSAWLTEESQAELPTEWLAAEETPPEAAPAPEPVAPPEEGWEPPAWLSIEESAPPVEEAPPPVTLAPEAEEAPQPIAPAPESEAASMAAWLTEESLAELPAEWLAAEEAPPEAAPAPEPVAPPEEGWEPPAWLSIEESAPAAEEPPPLAAPVPGPAPVEEPALPESEALPPWMTEMPPIPEPGPGEEPVPVDETTPTPEPPPIEGEDGVQVVSSFLRPDEFQDRLGTMLSEAGLEEGEVPADDIYESAGAALAGDVAPAEPVQEEPVSVDWSQMETFEPDQVPEWLDGSMPIEEAAAALQGPEAAPEPVPEKPGWTPPPWMAGEWQPSTVEPEAPPVAPAERPEEAMPETPSDEQPAEEAAPAEAWTAPPWLAEEVPAPPPVAEPLAEETAPAEAWAAPPWLAEEVPAPAPAEEAPAPVEAGPPVAEPPAEETAPAGAWAAPPWLAEEVPAPAPTEEAPAPVEAVPPVAEAPVEEVPAPEAAPPVAEAPVEEVPAPAEAAPPVAELPAEEVPAPTEAAPLVSEAPAEEVSAMSEPPSWLAEVAAAPAEIPMAEVPPAPDQPHEEETSIEGLWPPPSWLEEAPPLAEKMTDEETALAGKEIESVAVEEPTISPEHFVPLKPPAIPTREHLAPDVVQDYVERLLVEPNDYYARLIVASAYQEAGKYGLALEHYENIIQSAPSLPGQLVMNMEDMVRTVPDSEAAHRLLGDVYLKLGRYDDATAQYNRALELQ